VDWILAHWAGASVLRPDEKGSPEVYKGSIFDTAASPYLYRPAIYAWPQRWWGRRRSSSAAIIPCCLSAVTERYGEGGAAGRVAGDDFGQKPGTINKMVELLKSEVVLGQLAK